MQIDFYILDESSTQKSLYFACQLIEKIYSQQQSIYIHTYSHDEAERIDTLLWTYNENSFIPHNIYHADEEYPPAVQIGYENKPASSNNILINLHPQIPAFYQQFKYVIEIVFGDTSMQQLARLRYKQYRADGWEINTYKTKANES